MEPRSPSRFRPIRFTRAPSLSLLIRRWTSCSARSTVAWAPAPRAFWRREAMRFRWKVVTEAIVNAVVRRDYTDNSIQVMLFADRLEVVWKYAIPAGFRQPLTLEKLHEAHRSVPGNPLLGEALYLTEYIERMGTGTLDMIRRCVEASLPEPESRLPTDSSRRSGAQWGWIKEWPKSMDRSPAGQFRPQRPLGKRATSKARRPVAKGCEQECRRAWTRRQSPC